MRSRQLFRPAAVTSQREQRSQSCSCVPMSLLKLERWVFEDPRKATAIFAAGVLALRRELGPVKMSPVHLLMQVKVVAAAQD